MSVGADEQTIDQPIEQTAPIDPALACFVLLAKFLGLPADPQQIHHDRGKGDEPYTLEHLSRIGKRLGLIARLRDASRHELSKIPLPAILRTSDEGALILLKIEEDIDNPRYLIQRGDAERPEVLSADAFEDAYAGRLLLLTSREQVAGTSGPLISAGSFLPWLNIAAPCAMFLSVASFCNSWVWPHRFSSNW